MGASGAWPRLHPIAGHRRISLRPKSIENFPHNSLTTDCTGVSHSNGITGKTVVDSTCLVHGTSRVRESDKVSASIFHQGPRPRVALTGRMYGSNQSVEPKPKRNAWQRRGRPCMNQTVRGDFSLPVASARLENLVNQFGSLSITQAIAARTAEPRDSTNSGAQAASSLPELEQQRLF